MLGMTWSATLDAHLDCISQLQHDRNDALDAISDFLRVHPEHEADLALSRARVALL